MTILGWIVSGAAIVVGFISGWIAHWQHEMRQIAKMWGWW